MLLKVLVLVFAAFFLAVDGAKILGVFHMPSKSHHILGRALLKALASRGHQVTMLSPFPSKEPHENYEDLDLKELLEYKDKFFMNLAMASRNISFFQFPNGLTQRLLDINELVLNSSAVQEFEPLLGIAHSLDAATIAFTTLGSSFMIHPLTRNPAPPSYVPNLMRGHSDDMNFFHRVINTIASVVMEIVYYLYLVSQYDYLRMKYFPNAPTTNEMISNVSLVLLNSHFSIENPRPYVPNMIPIGGFHIEEPKELTGELKRFMDSAAEGVVFFSLGSNVKSSDLAPDQLHAVLNTFRKLPLKVLWKFENDDLPDLPPNVKIQKWLPQRDILAHPNLKLFITHGGLLSTTEAIYRSVPMVCIPVFGDQLANSEDSVRKGYAVKVDFDTLSEETLTNAVNEILYNPRFTENIQRTSLWLKDQPKKPLDNAVFWVEYVLRHNGAHHLKISGFKLPWYQFYLLDVIAFLGTIAFGIFLVLFVLLRALKRVISRKLNPRGKKSKRE